MARSEFDTYGRTSHKPIAYTIVAAPLLGIYVIYVVSTQAMFVHRALVLRDTALLRRSVLLLTTQAVFGIIFTVNAMLRFIIPNYPCTIELWFTSLGYMTWAVAFLLSMIRYYYLFRSHNTVAEETRVNPVTPENLLGYLARIEETAKRAYGMSDSDGCSHPAAEPEQRAVQYEARRTPVPIESIAPWRLLDPTDVLPPSNLLSQDYTRDATLIPDAQTQGARPNRIFRLFQRWRKKWSQLQFQVKYFLIGFGVHFVLIFIYLALATALFSQLSLKHPYYNCFFNRSLLPHTVMSGVFNIIIGPTYITFIWRFKDAYGIRTSMCILLAVGVVFWAGILVWRLESRINVRHISASFPFSVQILIAHTAFVVVPLIKSIRFAKLKKRGLGDSAREIEGYSLEAGPSNAAELMELTKQSFFETMRTPEGHERVEKYAQACFCPELLSFLDVYVAFKGCIFNELKREYTTCAIKEENTNHVHTGMHMIPTVNIVGSNVSSSLQLSSRAQMSEEKATHASTHTESVDAIVESDAAAPEMARSTYSDRTSRNHVHGTPYLTPPNHDSETNASTNGAASQRSDSWQIADIVETSGSTSYALQCIAIGIAEMMSYAFPQAEVTSTTTVPQSLRRELSAIIRTFILPSSALEINLTAEIVAVAQAYMQGDDMTFGMLDTIKNHVVELLYTNVYIRLYQEVG